MARGFYDDRPYSFVPRKRERINPHHFVEFILLSVTLVPTCRLKTRHHSSWLVCLHRWHYAEQAGKRNKRTTSNGYGVRV